MEEWAGNPKLKQHYWKDRGQQNYLNTNGSACFFFSYPFHFGVSDVYISVPSPSSPFHHSPALPSQPPSLFLAVAALSIVAPFVLPCAPSLSTNKICTKQQRRGSRTDPGKTSLCPGRQLERGVTLRSQRLIARFHCKALLANSPAVLLYIQGRCQGAHLQISKCPCPLISEARLLRESIWMIGN